MLGQVLVDAVVVGSIYALAAVGFAVIYHTTRVFHVAHAAVFILGAYMYYWAAVLLGLPAPVAVLLAVAAAVLVGVGIDAWLYEPVRARGGGAVGLVIVSLAVYIFLVNGIALAFGPEQRVFHAGAMEHVLPVHLFRITYLHVVILAIALACFLGLHVILRRTTVGRSLRALAIDRELTDLLGLGVRRLSVIAFAAGSALAVIAAILYAVDVGVTPGAGLDVFLIAAVAVIVGGAGQLWGAALGAYLLGLVTNLATLWLAGDWSQVVAFALLVVTLLLRPQGLLGDVRARKA